MRLKISIKEKEDWNDSEREDLYEQGEWNGKK